MRILWHSNASWSSTGYGVQTRRILPHLQKMGHDVAICAFYGLEGGMLDMNGIRVYPKLFDPYSNDAAPLHYEHFKADLIISLIDVWVLRNWGKMKWRWIPYMPVDSEPVPDCIANAVDGAYRVMSYSRFGEKLLNARGIKNHYIPHGVDCQIFTPADKSQAKQDLGFDKDDFVIGMVAANKGFPSRKAFPENMAAVASFVKRNPKAKVKLYLHTLEGTATGGVDFNMLLSQVGLLKDQVRFCNQYQYLMGFPDSYMAKAYNAMDVLLASTCGEGFGVPIIEAQACGVPVITTNFSSMPELTFSGYIADWTQRFFSPLGCWQVTPSIASVMAGLEWAYARRGDEKLKTRARKGAEDYDWNVLFEKYWTPFIKDIEQQIANEPKKES